MSKLYARGLLDLDAWQPDLAAPDHLHQMGRQQCLSRRCTAGLNLILRAAGPVVSGTTSGPRHCSAVGTPNWQPRVGSDNTFHLVHDHKNWPCAAAVLTICYLQSGERPESDCTMAEEGLLIVGAGQFGEPDYCLADGELLVVG